MRHVWILLVLGWATLASAAAGEETWAERLGYPPGERVLILHANYMGAAYEFNGPGKELLEGGLVQSVGLMPACPWFEEFAGWCRENPNHDVGVCLTLNSPNKLYRWGPVSRDGDVPSLVDPDGYLWRTELQLVMRADVEEVKREIEQQIKKVRAAGVRPTHITPFKGSLFARVDLLQAYLEAAERHWIPAVMVELTPANIEAFREEGFPLSDEMIDLIGRYSLPKLDSIHFIPDAETYESKREQFYEFVRDLPPGLAQIIAGAATETPGLKLITEGWQNRVWEHKLLTDPAVEKFLEDEEVVLTNWKEIMDRYHGEYLE